MTPMRWLYAAFWIFIGTVLFMQFNNYNQSITKAEVKAGPQQQHFYFPPTHQLGSPTGPTIKPDAPDVRQVGFSFDEATPSQGSFTCHVTLKNVGKIKAVGVQVLVSPFHGIQVGNPDGGRSVVRSLDDTDQVVQSNNQWVSFPDLAPGESATKDAIFLDQPGYSPGGNPQPQITFHAEGSSPAAPHSP